MRRPSTLALSTLLLLAPLAAACGDDGDDQAVGSPPGSEAPPAADGDEPVSSDDDPGTSVVDPAGGGGGAAGSDPVFDAGPVPDRAPELTGTVTVVTPSGPQVAGGPVGFVLVEELPGEDTGEKIQLSVPSGIAFQRLLPDGSSNPAAFADLAEGVVVEAWVDGPVAESYPAQADASALRITTG